MLEVSYQRVIQVVVVVKGWFWKDIPDMETFRFLKSTEMVPNWLHEFRVWGLWMTEWRKGLQKWGWSLCRSPEMSQHLAVLLVSFLKVGWSFWTTYKASKQIYRKLSTRRRWRKRSLRPWNCLLDGDLHLDVFLHINMTLAFAAFTSCWGSWNMKNI